jgi:hypothetical protein
MLIGITRRGVFLSDRPLDSNEGAKGHQLLEVILPEDCCDFPYYELVEDDKTVSGMVATRQTDQPIWGRSARYRAR